MDAEYEESYNKVVSEHRRISEITDPVDRILEMARANDEHSYKTPDYRSFDCDDRPVWMTVSPFDEKQQRFLILGAIEEIRLKTKGFSREQAQQYLSEALQKLRLSVYYDQFWHVIESLEILATPKEPVYAFQSGPNPRWIEHGTKANYLHLARAVRILTANPKLKDRNDFVREADLEYGNGATIWRVSADLLDNCSTARISQTTIRA